MPADELIHRHRDALAHFSDAVDRPIPVLRATALATVRDALPSAERLVVLGEINEDWAWTLRIQRVLDSGEGVLFDVATGAGPDVEDLIHEVVIAYLDLLLEITGDDYLGTQEIEGWSLLS